MAPILPGSPARPPPGPPDSAGLGRAGPHLGAGRPLRGPGRLAVLVDAQEVLAERPAVQEDLAVAEAAAGPQPALQAGRTRHPQVPPAPRAVTAEGGEHALH